MGGDAVESVVNMKREGCLLSNQNHISDSGVNTIQWASREHIILLYDFDLEQQYALYATWPTISNSIIGARTL